MNDTIQIQIGQSDGPVEYLIRETRAPQAYDGFGTIQLAEYNGTRLVLIRAEHYEWQSGRYSSGMFACAAPEYIDRTGIRQELWRRISGKT